MRLQIPRDRTAIVLSVLASVCLSHYAVGLPWMFGCAIGDVTVSLTSRIALMVIALDHALPATLNFFGDFSSLISSHRLVFTCGFGKHEHGTVSAEVNLTDDSTDKSGFKFQLSTNIFGVYLFSSYPAIPGPLYPLLP